MRSSPRSTPPVGRRRPQPTASTCATRSGTSRRRRSSRPSPPPTRTSSRAVSASSSRRSSRTPTGWRHACSRAVASFAARRSSTGGARRARSRSRPSGSTSPPTGSRGSPDPWVLARSPPRASWRRGRTARTSSTGSGAPARPPPAFDTSRTSACEPGPTPSRTAGSPSPNPMSRSMLRAPDGSTWRWGTSSTDRVVGDALDFCLVVTQRRHPDDTGLVVEGPVATAWIAVAQAFAGPPTDQRAPRDG